MNTSKVAIKAGLVLVAGTTLALFGGAGSVLAQPAPVQSFSPPDCAGEVCISNQNQNTNTNQNNATATAEIN